jgi:hypothetical protein
MPVSGTRHTDPKGSRKTAGVVNSTQDRRLWEELLAELQARHWKNEPRETLGEIRHKLMSAAGRCR